MAQVLALIVMVLFAGFSGSMSTPFDSHNSHAVVRAYDYVDAPSGTINVQTADQFVSADTGNGSHIGSAANECCTSSTCLNASHCHHSATAITAAIGDGFAGNIGPLVGFGPQDLPYPNFLDDITKPPKA